MAKSKDVKEAEVVEVVEAKELTANEFNSDVFAQIKKLTDEIESLKETLKPAELVENASLADCNRFATKNSAAINEMRKLIQPKRR